jgi:hypothetical protein
LHFTKQKQCSRLSSSFWPQRQSLQRGPAALALLLRFLFLQVRIGVSWSRLIRFGVEFPWQHACGSFSGASAHLLAQSFYNRRGGPFYDY